MTDLIAELEGVVREIELATPGKWPLGSDAAKKATNFLRTHHAELEATVRKAARYDWLNTHRLDSLTRNNMHDPRVCLPVGTDIFQQDAMDKAIDQAMHNSAREG